MIVHDPRHEDQVEVAHGVLTKGLALTANIP